MTDWLYFFANRPNNMDFRQILQYLMDYATKDHHTAGFG